MLYLCTQLEDWDSRSWGSRGSNQPYEKAGNHFGCQREQCVWDNGTILICADLTALNKAVQCKIHPMATVDKNLTKVKDSGRFFLIPTPDC